MDRKTPEIIVGVPPNYPEIQETFELSGNEIFAWDGVIYAPSSKLPEWLIAHEQVHFKQQKGDPVGWWRQYIDDPQFRLDQEVPAHKEELRVYSRFNKDRNIRIKKKMELAQRLSSKMYGRMIKFRDAMKLLS